MTSPTAPAADNSAAIAFIGGGNMARALIGGLLKRGHALAQIVVAEPFEATRAALALDFNVAVSVDNHTAVDSVRALAAERPIWLLAVKPQMLRSVCEDLRATAQAHAPLVISIAAGISLASLRSWLGPRATLVRCMPNTPALIGAGVSALYGESDVDNAARDSASALLSAAGSTVWLDSEAHMDAVTATSGSGPAYFFLLMEAMQEAAMAQGLSEAAARALVLGTAYGAAKMALESDVPAGTLRERVTSPGGTTAAALGVFEATGFRSHVHAAIQAATERGKALSAQFG
jgi:pyrroline-5-carboxylate reductase